MHIKLRTFTTEDDYVYKYINTRSKLYIDDDKYTSTIRD